MFFSDEHRIKEILDVPVLESYLKTYKYLMDTVQKTNVATDMKFQDTYRDFYQIRRFYSDAFASSYFEIMEAMKSQDEISFKLVFEWVRRIKNSAEMSFSSKMVHTFRSDQPIWDSRVATVHFGLSVPPPDKDWGKRETVCIDRYENYKEIFYEYMKSKEGKLLIECFDKKFPNYEISDVKKIDFILWQDRGRI